MPSGPPGNREKQHHDHPPFPKGGRGDFEGCCQTFRTNSPCPHRTPGNHEKSATYASRFRVFACNRSLAPAAVVARTRAGLAERSPPELFSSRREACEAEIFVSSFIFVFGSHIMPGNWTRPFYREFFFVSFVSS